MAQKKYQCYYAIMKSLKTSGFAYPGKLGTYLLDTFLENEGQIKSVRVYELGLCSEDQKEFRDWRKKLCDKGWLDFVIENNKSVTYKPGKKLLKYVNREKIATHELATKNDLFSHTKPIKEELDKKADKSELEELRKAMKRVLNIIDPPADEQKEKKFVQGEYDCHLQLIRKNSSEI